MYKLKIRYKNKEQQEHEEIFYYEKEEDMKKTAFISEIILKNANYEIIQETQEKGEFKRTEKIWNYRKY